jgi:hypothetical protein
MENNQFRAENKPEILEFEGVLRVLQEHLGVSESDLTSFFSNNKNISNQSGLWSITREPGPKVVLRKCAKKSPTTFTKFHCTIGTERFGQFDKVSQQVVHRPIPKMLEREGRKDPAARTGYTSLGHGPDKEGGGEGRS